MDSIKEESVESKKPTFEQILRIHQDQIRSEQKSVKEKTTTDTKQPGKDFSQSAEIDLEDYKKQRLEVR